MSKRPELAAFVQGVSSGDRSWLARALTLVESSRADDRVLAREVLQELLPRTGGAYRVGLTGVPGVGKSTLIESLGTMLCDDGHRVAVLAIDPSSARSGGSILGDKTRMQRLANHPRAFVRPSPAGGALGGVARATQQALLLCEAAGHDVVLIETVGVGQSETLVAQMVDAFVLLLLANAGDELQGIKRGIIELADVLAINKADGEAQGACEWAAAEYRRALALMQSPHPQWQVPVVLCSGLHRHGIAELWQTLASYRALLQGDGTLAKRRTQQNVRWMWRAVQDELMARLHGNSRVQALSEALTAGVESQTWHPEEAALQVVQAFLGDCAHRGEKSPSASCEAAQDSDR